MSSKRSFTGSSANTSSIPPPSRTIYNRGGLRIQTDDSGLFAFLSFSPSESMPVLDETTFRSALEKARVVFGLDGEAIAQISGSDKELSRVVVARGRAAVEGTPPRLDYKFPTDPYAIRGAKSDREKIDYRERGQLPFVKPGDEIATLVEGTDPIPGRSVTGNDIKASLELGSGLEPGRNVEVEGNRYLAKISGGPRLDDHGRIEVVETWNVNRDIDIHTGNIRYPGAIRILGVVQGGFEVHAKSIRIDGVENNAIVEAEGDIGVSGGIIGGQVKAGGSVSARFINNATVVCSGDINVKLSIVNSDVSSSGFLRCQTIIGGMVATLKGIECVNLSSKANRATVIFGIDPIKQQKISDLIRRKMELEGMIHQKKEEMSPLLERLAKLERIAVEREHLLAEKDSLSQHLGSASIEDNKSKEFFENRLQELTKQLQEIEANEKDLRKEIPSLKSRFATQEREIASLERQLQQLDEEHQRLAQADEELKAPPKVVVKGEALLGTRISGPHARLVVDNDMKRVIFRERKRTEPDETDKDKAVVSGRPRYRIEAERL